MARVGCWLALGGWAASLAAQQMPQDNWRYNQHQFSAPDPNQTLRSIAIGVGGVYVGRGDPATAVLQFQENGVFIRQFGSFGSIRGIACDSAGNVYVLDATNSTMTVSAFDQNGAFLRQWGSAGTNDGQFGQSVDSPTMLAVGTNDQIYVCDPGNTRVQVFDVQGNFLRKWGVAGSLPGQFPANHPQSIAASPNGWFYVSTGIYDSSGNYIKNLPQYYWVMSNGPWWVTYNSSAMAISPDGVFLGVVASWGSYSQSILACWDVNNGGLVAPYPATIFGFPNGTCKGVAFNKRGDILIIIDKQVQILEREYSSVQNPPTPPAMPLPVVLATAQRTNTAWLDIDFQITDADSSNVTAAALAFLNGGNTLSAAVPMSTFMEGTASNLGTNVPSNTKLHFTWNMGADWSVDFAQVQVEVLAKDNRNLMGFHWITVPSDGVNPAFQVSSAPVPESELLSVWYWFIATHNPGITFANGNVTGVGGAYDGQLLASSSDPNYYPYTGSSTTSAGRAFAYSQMNVRAITPSEITRANAGRYGFSSVDANSVVKLP